MALRKGKKWIIFLFFTIGFLCAGCVSEEPAKNAIVCNEPYIRVGATCCLDMNDNSICDTDEEIPCSGSAKDYCDDDIRYYEATCQNGQWIYQSEHCPFGCEQGVCKEEACPTSCDDGNPCTRDYCSSATNFACIHDPLDGGQSGCSGSAGSCTEYTCSNGNCITQPQTPCCGNEICEEDKGETYGNCLVDCPAPSPKLDIEILGCDTWIDITHGFGEVTNVYAEVRNIGNADAANVMAVASASDEGEAHPNKHAPIGSIPFGYAARIKMTIDTTYEEFGTIDVTASADNADPTSKSTRNCAKINPDTIEGLGEIIKIASELGY